MASPVHAALCALIATAFWSWLGYALGRHLLPRVLALGSAPVIGWAVHSAVMLPLCEWTGFSPGVVIGAGVLFAAAAGLSFRLRAPAGAPDSGPAISGWIFAALALALVLALVPAVAILPKFSGGAVQFSDPVFDHAKIAFIDAMTRQGVPPVNPVFGEFGASGRLAYYYLWHFSAAGLALASSASGWEADIGATWFTAFASLALMMGLAVWLAQRAAAAIWVVALAAAGSMWITLFWIFRGDDFRPVLWPSTGMSGWLFQATWVPQHLMAASCAVVAVLLLLQYALSPRAVLIVPLALIVAAGFESSTFVGGVTFAAAALAALPLLLTAAGPKRRLHLVAGLAVAALLVAGLIAPFIFDQLATVRARGDASPIVISAYHVFGDAFPYWLRRIMDVPGYWLLILPVELPASFVAGVIALVAGLRGALPREQKLALSVLACVAGAGMTVSWLLVSTLGQNNDLGLRAIIPAEIVLIVAVAAMAAGAATGRSRTVIAAIALAGLALSLPDTATMIADNTTGTKRPGGEIFAQTPELWAAVRAHAAPGVRVANNPAFLSDVTPWPVNMSWALLANRSSCFAGPDLALAYAPLPAARRKAIDAQFARVFDGTGSADDVKALATTYGCETVVVAPQDGAWNNDPFAASPDYRAVEVREGRWRIYERVANQPVAAK